MREYEAMLVLQPELEDEAIDAILQQVASVVESDGGEVTSTGQLVDKKGTVAEVTEGWTSRRLAFPINGRTEGYYAVLHLQGPSQVVENVEQSLRLNEDVLRYMVTLRV
ncbi:MAG: 30S ribosomal protein S6 [Anaerolineae bacterium]|jgi:small subunit ribosomal protein S6